MLRELHIKNVAVIQEVTVEFENGFQALTGETGAGKSILIDSINMALGSRSSRDLIRTGCDFASVDLAFEIDDTEAFRALEELGIECDDCTIVISRRIFADGKSKCHVNGRLTPLNMVREIGSRLLTIHGQNDNQSILSPAKHIHFVDEFGDTTDVLDEYKECYNRCRGVEKALDDLNTDENEKNRLIELLSFQVEEIDKAKLKADEEEALEERRVFLQNTELISESAGGAYYALYGGDEYANGVCDGLTDALNKLSNIKDFEAKLSGYYDTLSSALADIEDITRELRMYFEGIDYSQADLDEVENRLSLIYSLKRKYGNSVEEILEYANSSRERLESIERSDEKRVELEAELVEIKKELCAIAERLSNKRMESALRLQECIMNELADLDMQKMRFSVSVSPLTDDGGEVRFTSNGSDNVEFLISANPGESLKPLAKIASGGEMSRIMLAIKSVLSDTDAVETMIFDEIDTGVSGRAAQKIAEKMSMLAKKRQLLCITHLAQIAAMADHQYLIAKTSDEESTKTNVSLVEGDERLSELARIIGGVRVTDTTINAAREMLELAESCKADRR